MRLRRGSRRSLLDGELCDLLPLAFVENPEVVFDQVSDGMSLAIPHYHRHFYQVALRLESDRLVMRGNLLRLSRGGRCHNSSFRRSRGAHGFGDGLGLRLIDVGGIRSLDSGRSILSAREFVRVW